MPSNRRSVRFADDKPPQASSDASASGIDLSLKKRFMAPIDVTDPTAGVAPQTISLDTHFSSQSSLHQRLAARLRDRNAAIRKAVLMNIRKPSMDSTTDPLAFITTKSAEEKSEETLVSEIDRFQSSPEKNSASPATTKTERHATQDDSTPLVEWWDEKWYFPLSLTADGSIAESARLLRPNCPHFAYKTTCDPSSEPLTNVVPPNAVHSIQLPSERRSERKRKRATKTKERLDSIQRGEATPNAPKLTMENIQGILKNRKMPTMDPIECESLVIADQVRRRQNHEERNQNTKKTPEERSAKRRAQLQREASESQRVLLFKIHALRGPREIHENPTYLKMILNVQQLYATGVLSTINGEHFLLLECGRKPAQKIKALLSRRMQSVLQSSLLHEGEIAKARFTTFDVKDLHDKQTAKTFFQDMEYAFVMDLL